MLTKPLLTVNSTDILEIIILLPTKFAVCRYYHAMICDSNLPCMFLYVPKQFNSLWILKQVISHSKSQTALEGTERSDLISSQGEFIMLFHPLVASS